MSSLFFIICSASLVFFTVFLLNCWKGHKASKQPTVHRIAPAEVVDSAAGRRFLVHLEEEMAEFVASHSRISAMLLVATVLLALPNAAHG